MGLPLLGLSSEARSLAEREAEPALARERTVSCAISSDAMATEVAATRLRCLPLSTPCLGVSTVKHPAGLSVLNALSHAASAVARGSFPSRRLMSMSCSILRMLSSLTSCPSCIDIGEKRLAISEHQLYLMEAISDQLTSLRFARIAGRSIPRSLGAASMIYLV